MLEGIPEYETIDFIRAILGKEGFIQYCKGTIMKYIARAEKKGGDEDLRKAGEFMNYIIDELGDVEQAGKLLQTSLLDEKLTESDKEYLTPFEAVDDFLLDGDKMYSKLKDGVTTYIVCDKDDNFLLECKRWSIWDMIPTYRSARGIR